MSGLTIGVASAAALPAIDGQAANRLRPSRKRIRSAMTEPRDTELFELVAELRSIEARATELDRRFGKACDLLADWARGEHPKVDADFPRDPRDTVGYGDWEEKGVSWRALRESNRRDRAGVPEGQFLSELQRLARARLHWWVLAERRRRAAHVEYEASRELIDAELSLLSNQTDATMERIVSCPAQSLAGLAIKLRLIAEYQLSETPDGGFEPPEHFADQLILAVMADVGRMAREGVPTAGV